MNNENGIHNSFEILERRVLDIKTHFKMDELKFKSLELEPLNDCDYDQIRAYIALCHAEFESYLEQHATDVVDKALLLWTNGRKPTLPLIALFAHFEHIEKNDNTTQKIHMITSRFKRGVIKQNNGIKSENIRKLFVPIGVDFDEIDSAWTSTLDSYGAKRGETVHMSAKVQQPLDISTVLADTEIVKNGIKDFELLILNLIDS